MIDESVAKMELRKRIRFYRSKQYMSSVELATKANITPKTIQRLENDAYDFNPTLGTLISIANVLHITLSELVDGL